MVVKGMGFWGSLALIVAMGMGDPLAYALRQTGIEEARAKERTRLTQALLQVDRKQQPPVFGGLEEGGLNHLLVVAPPGLGEKIRPFAALGRQEIQRTVVNLPEKEPEILGKIPVEDSVDGILAVIPDQQPTAWIDFVTAADRPTAVLFLPGSGMQQAAPRIAALPTNQIVATTQATLENPERFDQAVSGLVEGLDRAVRREWLIETIQASRAMAVIPVPSAEEAIAAGRIAASQGIIPEITYRVPEGIGEEAVTEAIRRLSEELRALGIPVAVGSVFTPRQVEGAVKAGAQVIVSPAFFPEVVRKGKELGAVAIPGIRTPAEAKEAVRAGVDFIKFFPFQVGTIDSYRIALQAPLPADLKKRRDEKIELVPAGQANGNVATPTAVYRHLIEGKGKELFELPAAEGLQAVQEIAEGLPAGIGIIPTGGIKLGAIPGILGKHRIAAVGFSLKGTEGEMTQQARAFAEAVVPPLSKLVEQGLSPAEAAAWIFHKAHAGELKMIELSPKRFSEGQSERFSFSAEEVKNPRVMREVSRQLRRLADASPKGSIDLRNRWEIEEGMFEATSFFAGLEESTDQILNLPSPQERLKAFLGRVRPVQIVGSSFLADYSPEQRKALETLEGLSGEKIILQGQGEGKQVAYHRPMNRASLDEGDVKFYGTHREFRLVKSGMESRAIEVESVAENQPGYETLLTGLLQGFLNTDEQEQAGRLLPILKGDLHQVTLGVPTLPVHPLEAGLEESDYGTGYKGDGLTSQPVPRVPGTLLPVKGAAARHLLVVALTPSVEEAIRPEIERVGSEFGVQVTVQPSFPKAIDFIQRQEAQEKPDHLLVVGPVEELHRLGEFVQQIPLPVAVVSSSERFYPIAQAIQTLWESGFLRMTASADLESPTEVHSVMEASVEMLLPATGLEEKTGYVVVGAGVGRFVPREVPHRVAVNGFLATAVSLETGKLPTRIISIAAGLEELKRLKGLGIPEENIVHGWTFANAREAVEAEVNLAKEQLLQEGLRPWVIRLSARTFPEWLAKLHQQLLPEWLEAAAYTQAGLEQAFLLDQEV